MEKIIKEGKVFEDIVEEIISENNLVKEDLIFKKTIKKGGLFKGTCIEVTAILKKDIIEVIKEYLKEVINNLGLEVNFESSMNEERTVLKMYSDNNPILIGKNGLTIKALEELVKQMLQSKYGIYFKISLDVEDYKIKKEKNLERMAINLAKDVVRTNTEIKLDNMSSYERRIVHNALTNFKGIKTESEGEDPNRHIVIKPL